MKKVLWICGVERQLEDGENGSDGSGLDGIHYEAVKERFGAPKH
jgi:hypothetical protein